MGKEKNQVKPGAGEGIAKEAAIPAGKVEAPLHTRIATLLYYDANAPKAAGALISFEKQTEEVQKPFLSQATRLLIAVDKLDLAIVKKVDPKIARELARKNLETLTAIIKEFVKGLKTTKPGLFPAEELAHRILD
jgi:hypothetical protein